MRVWRRADGVTEAVERADSALARVGLGQRSSTLAGGLSHGDKRKLEIAMMLAGDPRVVLLDEPMAGVSAEDVHGLVELDQVGAAARSGKTVLMVEHHIEVVTGVADRIAVMHHGALLACDTPAAVMANRDRAGGVRGGALSCGTELCRLLLEAQLDDVHVYLGSRTSSRASRSPCPRAASPRSSAGTASARRRRCARSWASRPRAGAGRRSPART